MKPKRYLKKYYSSHSNSLQNPTFQSYLIQLAENIDPAKDTDASSTYALNILDIRVLTRLLIGFFASLPCLLQSNIIDFATGKFTLQKNTSRTWY